MQVPKTSLDRLQATALPGANVPTNAPIEAFGGGAPVSNLATAEQGLSKEVINFSVQQENHANDLAVQNATSAAIQKKNDLVYGKADPENPQKRIPGLVDLTGAQAFSAPEQVGDEYKKFQDDTLNGLSNNKQKQAFMQAAQRIGLDLHETIQKHMYTEGKKFDDETTKASIATSQDDAVLNYQQPGKVEGSLQDQKAEILKKAARSGQSSAQTGVELRNAYSTTHTAVIDKMLANGQDQAAKAYYDANKDQITDHDKSTRLDKALEEGSLRGESQRFVDRVTAPTLNDAGQVVSKPNMQDAMEKVQQITDPKLRDAAASRVKDFYSTQKLAEAQQAEDQYKAVSNVIEQTKSRDSIPPSQWLELSPAQRSAADTRINQLRKGIQPETNWQKYYDLKELASNPETRTTFMRKDLMTLRPEMNDTEFKELTNLQASLRNKDASVTTKLDGYRTDSAIVNDALTAAGIKPNPKPSSGDAQKVALFRRKVDEQMRVLQERTGKKASNQEVQSIVDNLMVKTVTEKGWLWDTKKRAFELEPTDQASLDIKDIPKGELPKIKEALQRRNRPVNDATIIDVYKRKIQGMSGGL